MQIIELYIKTGGYNGTGTAINTSSISDFSIDFIEVGAKIGDSIYFPSLNLTSTITVVNQNNISINDSILTANDLTKYEIVAQWDKLDLFKDESVSITDSIKNLKDPSKIFTAFSQQFNVPASKNNSKIFKHYENANVVNSFDARFKADALIKLNGADYKKGKLKLNGVSLKDNSPNSYKLVFFGETVELKDLLNDRELSSLSYPESLNFDYNYANLKSKLTTDPETLDVCVPLITHTKNMRYSNNGYTDVITGNYLSPFDLKPAIKVRRIIEAIQDTIPQIQFSNEFLNTTDFNNLWLWLHREKGFSASADEGGGQTIITNRFGLLNDDPSNFQLVSGDEVRPSMIAFSSDFIFGYNRFVKMDFSIQTSSPDQQFTLLIRRASDNQVVIEQDYTGSTNYDFTHTINFINYGQGICDVFIDLISDDSFNILSYQNVVTGFKAINFFTYTEFTGTYSAPNLSLSNKFIVANQMPKMKVLNFLTNIFKMFNLVAFKDGDVMKVLPLNDFYSDGVTYEVTFLVQKAEEINGVKFSHEQIGNNDWDGGKYDITLDLEKMMYERLNNEDTGSLSDICQGAMLDKEFKPTIGKPLLLYIDRQYAPNQIQLYNGTDLENISFYNRPSQVYVNPSSVVTSSSSSLNFGAEIDEFFRLQIGTDLFTKYYLDYIEGIFDRQGRILKVSSYLPLSIILKLKLNDTFSIANSLYRINSIKTNLLTNKSSLELFYQE
jgi:hypothetical protein